MSAHGGLLLAGNASIQTSVTLHFPYCAYCIVDHFCEVPALLKLSCEDTSAYELALSTSGVLILVLPLSLIAISYGHVLGAVMRMRSEEAWNKAFTICSSRITVEGLVYGAGVFMYMVPVAYHSPPPGQRGVPILQSGHPHAQPSYLQSEELGGANGFGQSAQQSWAQAKVMTTQGVSGVILVVLHPLHFPKAPIYGVTIKALHSRLSACPASSHPMTSWVRVFSHRLVRKAVLCGVEISLLN